MDEETVDLIIGLQIEDLRSFAATRKGKAVEGSPNTDEEIAIEIQINELHSQKLVMADIIMARSISRAVQDDGTTIAVLADEERRSVQDHQFATQLSGQTLSVPLDVPDCRVDEEILSRFDSLNICQVDTMSCYSESVVSFIGAEAGESSSWASSRGTGKSNIRHECVACSEIRETVQLQCQHRYCRACVTRLISDATVDESLFPPRCCGQTMPMSLIRPYISAELAAKIQQKAIEYGTPYRTYCTSCGVFLNLDNIEGHRGHCFRCDQDTCILCKGSYHNGDCPRDAALESVLQIAREAGWQRCFGCHAVVERREGCNHIKCRCQTEFCYECGRKWRNCTCVLYDEGMLIRRAHQIADRPAEPGAAAMAVPRGERVQQIARELHERHDCDHRGRWRRVEGRHRCEECQSEFILECRHCMLQACVRCRCNRL